MNKWVKASAIAAGCALSAVFLYGAPPALAQVLPASDAPAGYVVFPKIIVNVTAPPATPDIIVTQTDTFIQLTNTSRVGTAPRIVHCFYIDGSSCQPDDFTIELTPGQPTAWSVHDGAGPIPGRGDTFVGELKCIEVSSILSPVPIAANDLKGEASIYTVTSGTGGSVDVRSYNAIGLQALNVSTAPVPTPIGRQCSFGTNPGTPCSMDNDPVCVGPGAVCAVTMCLGATSGSAECPSADYVSCPSTLILNHFFDYALDPVSGETITTDITFSPCTEDLLEATFEAQPITRVQFLTFNEFEQRMSTATLVQCFKEVQLSRIDAKPGAEAASIFNVNVQGTLVGQTRIRPVQVPDETTVGHGLLAIAEEFHGPASVALNLNHVGVNAGRGDFVHYLP